MERKLSSLARKLATRVTCGRRVPLARSTAREKSLSSRWWRSRSCESDQFLIALSGVARVCTQPRRLATVTVEARQTHTKPVIPEAGCVMVNGPSVSFTQWRMALPAVEFLRTT
jgi:hypothetical protein